MAEPDEGVRDDPNEPRAPERLARALERHLGAPGELGELGSGAKELERRVLAAVKPELARRRARPRLVRRWAPLAAAAAVVAALAAWRWLATRPDEHASPFAAADVDRNGTVDVLDAFAIARGLERGGAELPSEWDVDRDGRVDARDVEIAMDEAVRVGA